MMAFFLGWVKLMVMKVCVDVGQRFIGRTKWDVDDSMGDLMGVHESTA